MAETRTVDLVLGDLIKVFTASVPTIVSLNSPGGVGAMFGFKTTAPGAGAPDWQPTIAAYQTFFMDPEDTLWVSLPGIPVGVPDVSVCISPIG